MEPHAPTAPSDLVIALKAEAARLGFELAGIAPALTPLGFPAFTEWLEKGYAGEMQYLADREEAYRHPSSVLPGVKSVLMLAMNYRSTDPVPTEEGHGRVSRYAWGEEDYHDFIRRQVKQLGAFFESQMPGQRWRAVIDTAPLLERDFARLAGLGWFGKNTMLINTKAGSWLFLAALLLDVDLPADQPFETSHCGTCTRCLDICPTDAFVEPYVLDSRRCISYLTIELRDQPVPDDLREGVGEWLFGCDLCQDVCPWNRKAPRTDEPTFQPVAGRDRVDLHELLTISSDEFKQRFHHTPMERTGWKTLLRNAAIVLGNQRSGKSLESLMTGIEHDEPLIRGACIWALSRFADSLTLDGMPQIDSTSPANVTALLQKRRSVEQNAEVIAEIDSALTILAGRSSTSHASPTGKG
ncbi:MAG: tRNA epoxyqueuosine(34) reductase QueG [Planctomycetota bacterium]|nr:tRNA epoxyqueuosine(34) reductase QueG [Planctomycetota bacterium]MDA1213066.1 tRNA epoxyqueuosine(34) reductase QueG [Planctomycetota bacterium]